MQNKKTPLLQRTEEGTAQSQESIESQARPQKGAFTTLKQEKYRKCSYFREATHVFTLFISEASGVARTYQPMSHTIWIHT